MYKSLSPTALGISGRQSELIELALTYGFRSLEVDIDEYIKKAVKQSVEHAARFLTSANIHLGSFELPLKWRGTEEVYRAELEKLPQIAEVAAAGGATVCQATIYPASDTFPYHDNFELHRKRLAEMGGILGSHKLKLGLKLLAAPSHRADREFQFVAGAEALLALLKSISESNVGIYLDTWNWHVGGGTPDQLTVLGNRVVGITVADVPADADLTKITEAKRLLPSEEFTIDVAAILQQLAQQGVEGPVSLAPSPSSFTGLTREAIVQKCSSLLDGLWKAAGFVKPPKTAPALSSS